MARTKLQCTGVTKVFGIPGREVVALEDVSLHVDHNEFVCMVGASGCGKSTFLKIVAGLLDPTAGALSVDDKPVQGPGLDRGLVFQSYTLFPWLTVQQNVEFALKKKRLPQAEKAAAARRLLGLVGLEGFEQAYPNQLSGGMQQRVAIARALVQNPSILLMDEPFGALDAQTRSVMQELLLQVWQSAETTILFVTHDIDEAVFMSDRVYVLSSRPGRIKAEIRIDLPRPRNWEMQTTEPFLRLKREILGLIRSETLKGFNAT